MDIDRFITLQTVVEEGSFARAANKLCCTQSTVTYHIKELEQELSVQLFEKIGRRMLLTDAGRTVLPLSRELTQAVEHIRRACRGATGNRTLRAPTSGFPSAWSSTRRSACIG